MKKILVVNNDFDTMTLLKNWLEKKGLQGKIYGQPGRSSPRIMKEFQPDLVMVDVLQKDVARTIKN